jgi:hypothetical protein
LKNVTSTERRPKNATVMHDISKSLQSEFEQCFLVLSTDMPGQEKEKTKTILHLPPPCKLPEEAARDLVMSYMGGSLTQAEKRDFEIHFILCRECRYKLEIIQNLIGSPIGEEETSAPLDTLRARIDRWDCKRNPSNRVTSQHAAAR